MGGNAPLDAHIGRAVDIFGLIPAQIEAALDNYADFTDEIDEIHTSSPSISRQPRTPKRSDVVARTSSRGGRHRGRVEVEVAAFLIQ